MNTTLSTTEQTVDKNTTNTAPVKKWTTSAGPRMTKQVSEALSGLRWEGKAVIEKGGIIGGEEYSHTVTPLCTGTLSQVCWDEMDRIGEKYSYTITAENYKEILTEIASARAKVIAGRPVIDNRITAEAAAIEAAARAAREQERQTEAARQTEALHAAGQLTKSEKSHIRITDISAVVKEKLQKKYPQCRFSVTTDTYAGGQSITVALMSGPFDAIDREKMIAEMTRNGNAKYITEKTFGHAQLSKYGMRGGYEKAEGRSNGTYLTKEAFEAIQYAIECCDYYNWDDSDSQIDYYSVNFSDSYNIGKWDKPYIKTTAPAAPADHGTASSDDPDRYAPGGTQIRHNTDKGGIEILFPGKPSPAILEQLKAAGWRWSRFNKVWYKTDTEQNEAEARRIIGQ